MELISLGIISHIRDTGAMLVLLISTRGRLEGAEPVQGCSVSHY